ncbi:MAG: class I SAM-dependent methyltransferase [Phycisphaerae bacterium]
MNQPPRDDDLIRLMQQYYDQRAGEYDLWYLRCGRYDTPELNELWADELADLAGHLRNFARAHRAATVLELACGTGFWTALVGQFCRLVATDYSARMLQRCGRRLRTANVTATLVRADAYRLPFGSACFDAAFAGFFISHVPRSRRHGLLSGLCDVVRPGGQVLLFDGMRPSCAAGSAPDHRRGQIQRRCLDDGRAYPVLKIYYDPPSLARLLRPYGRDVAVTTTARFFILGSFRVA